MHFSSFVSNNTTFRCKMFCWSIAVLYIAWISADIYFCCIQFRRYDTGLTWTDCSLALRNNMPDILGLMKGLWTCTVHRPNKIFHFHFRLDGWLFTHVNHFNGECTVSRSLCVCINPNTAEHNESDSSFVR